VKKRESFGRLWDSIRCYFLTVFQLTGKADYDCTSLRKRQPGESSSLSFMPIKVIVRQVTELLPNMVMVIAERTCAGPPRDLRIVEVVDSKEWAFSVCGAGADCKPGREQLQVSASGLKATGKVQYVL